MDTAATRTAAPGLDETGLLLAEVNMFLEEKRNRAAATAPQPAPEREYISREITSREIRETRTLPEARVPETRPLPEARAIPVPRKPREPEEKPAITQRQLRALKRKHLFIMIRDLEQELQQVKKEKAEILLAYQAGCRPRP